MNRTLLLILLMAWGIALHAQGNMESVLAGVEVNNIALAAHRANAAAQRAASRVGLYPANPEAELAHLRGNPAAQGNRTDFNIRQEFDFPTAYLYRARIAGIKEKQADLEYQRVRREVLHQARLLCVKVVYQNALVAELEQRHRVALAIADVYKTKLDLGSAGVIEHNKARLSLLAIEGELEGAVIERDVLLMSLAALNGGIPVSLADTIFPAADVPGDFGQWYALAQPANPYLQWLEHEVAAAGQEVKLVNAIGLPSISAGYMSETVAGEQFRGVTVGLTIPLWEQRGTSRHARARVAALQSAEADARHQLYSSMKAAHARVVALQARVTTHREQLAAHSNREILAKALHRGEVSLTEYLLGLSLHHDGERQLLEMELELQLALAELLRY